MKERLRMVLRESDPDRTRLRLYEFYTAAADAHMDETSRLATTLETWWPAILIALTADITNARTEGFNRIIKQAKRVGCGFTNMTNCERRHKGPHRPHQRAENSSMNTAPGSVRETV